MYVEAIKNYNLVKKNGFDLFDLFTCHKSLAMVYSSTYDFAKCREEARTAIQVSLSMVENEDFYNSYHKDLCKIYGELEMTSPKSSLEREVFNFGRTVFANFPPLNANPNANIHQFYCLADQLQSLNAPFKPVIQDFINVAIFLIAICESDAEECFRDTHFKDHLNETETRNKFNATLQKLKELPSLQNLIEGTSFPVAVAKKLQDQEAQIKELKTKVQTLENELDEYKKLPSAKKNSHALEAESGEPERKKLKVDASSPLLAENHFQGYSQEQAAEIETSTVASPLSDLNRN